MKNSFLALAAIATSLIASGAHAEYPERPITMIVAYSAGGGTDVAARTLVPYIEKYLGKGASITVLNKAGAGGEVGFTELAQMKPDGYVIGFINTPNLVSIPIQRKARYSLQSLQPIANIVYDPGAFSVLPSAKMKNLADLVAYAKAHPGAVTYGTTGIGSDDHLAALAFERAAGVKLQHVPFSGEADVRAAVLGGHIMMASMNAAAAISDAKEGNLVMLGQMGNSRWEGAPDVPTFKEQGFDIVMGSDRGVGAPAGIPDEALKKLETAIRKAVEDPDFQAAAAKQALPLAYQDSAAFTAHLQNLDKTLRALWAEQPWVQQ